MNRRSIIRFCKDLGCCDACCLRYVGIKDPKYWVDSNNDIKKYQDSPSEAGHDNTLLAQSLIDVKSIKQENSETQHTEDMIQNNHGTSTNEDNSNKSRNNESNTLDLYKIKTEPHTTDALGSSSAAVKKNWCKGIESPPTKRCKINICSSCLGLLQEDMWMETFEMVKEVLEKKRYDCYTFACGLSSPLAIILREKAIILRICDNFSDYDENSVTALKEAWKWSFATRMAMQINKTLDSGAVSPLLITLNYDYPDELQELEVLKCVSPMLFESRSQQKRRFTAEFSRRFVEQALEEATLESINAAGGCLPLATASATCVSVVCNHNPIYIGGRYIKLSRNLPQSPWIIDGRRIMPSSVQEVIFKPIADLYTFSLEEAELRLKFISAGREDVDVRCLGEGRPFTIEVTDPRRQLTAEELAQACEEICKSGDVIVKSMVPICRDDLVQLKKGEESKSKTYEAVCIKLTHSEYDELSADSPVIVTDDDIKRINQFRNTNEGDPWQVSITQKTPIRVLHRRPLLTRTRGIISLTAYSIPEHPQLFRIVVETTAGTYVKEWVSGELGRSAPALSKILCAKVDIVALDVSAVHLEWPPVVMSTK